MESHIKDLPSRHGTRVRPSGRLPSERLIPAGSKMDGISEDVKALLEYYSARNDVKDGPYS